MTKPNQADFSGSRPQIPNRKSFICKKKNRPLPLPLGNCFAPNIFGCSLQIPVDCKRKRVQKQNNGFGKNTPPEHGLSSVLPIWAGQIIKRVRPGFFSRSRYFVSVHAFFCNRLESIPVIRIYSGAMRFQVEVTEKKILHIKFARFGVETQKNRPEPTDVKFHPQPKSFEIPPMECS